MSFFQLGGRCFWALRIRRESFGRQRSLGGTRPPWRVGKNNALARRICRRPRSGRSTISLAILCSIWIATSASAQTAVNVPRPEEKERTQKAVERQQEKKAQQTSAIEFRGNTAFNEKALRSSLKEEIATIDQYGLTAARGDDAAFFLQLFYRKQGYAKAEVRYTIQSGNRLR